MRFPPSPAQTRLVPSRLFLAAVTPALMLAGCTEQGQAADADPATTATQASDAETPQTAASQTVAFTPQTPPTNLPPDILAEMPSPLTDAMLKDADGPVAPVDGGFDVHSLPLSAATLGAFPYIRVPDGYSSQGFAKLDTASARFPFWANNMEFWVDGRFYGTAFKPLPGEEFSQDAIEAHFTDAVHRLGGAEVGNGKIPPAVFKKWPAGMKAGLGDVANYPVKTWLVRHTSGNVWVHLVMTPTGASYIIAHEKPHGVPRARPTDEEQ